MNTPPPYETIVHERDVYIRERESATIYVRETETERDKYAHIHKRERQIERYKFHSTKKHNSICTQTIHLTEYPAANSVKNLKTSCEVLFALEEDSLGGGMVEVSKDCFFVFRTCDVRYVELELELVVEVELLLFDKECFTLLEVELEFELKFEFEIAISHAVVRTSP